MAGAFISTLAACLLVLASCSNGAAPSPAAAPTEASRDESRPAALPPDEIEIRLRAVADGLDSPLGVTGAGDGSRRLYVVEQGGRILVYRDQRVRSTPFLDISDRTEGGGEQGLLGLAFHPRYEDNRRFFVNYTDLAGDTVIAEYRRAPRDRLRAMRRERVILTVDQPFANHNGGGLAFGPDGMLYVALGDGGSAGDPQNNGQRTDTLLGKVLRIDVSSRATPYEIPDDNPLVGRPAARGEIWDYGLRNSWRISFDRETGELWIADVGQGEWEEVNREPAGSGGRNYGWRVKEGRDCYPAGEECAVTAPLEDMVDPLAVYSHDLGCSITGGYVYRGRAFPELAGNYFFGDYCSGRVWAVAAGGPENQDPVRLLDSKLSISSFGEDDRGELFVTDLAGGRLLRVVPAT